MLSIFSCAYLHFLFGEVYVHIFFQYSNRLLVLLLTCTSSVYNLNKIPLCDTCFANIFFQFVACLFFLYTFFKDYKFLILMKSNLSILTDKTYYAI